MAKLDMHVPKGETFTAEEWQDEKLVLEDADGGVSTPSSVSHQYQYDDKKRLTGITLTGYFDPGVQARSVTEMRYTVTRLMGLRALPYRFSTLPLPCGGGDCHLPNRPPVKSEGRALARARPWTAGGCTAAASKCWCC